MQLEKTCLLLNQHATKLIFYFFFYFREKKFWGELLVTHSLKSVPAFFQRPIRNHAGPILLIPGRRRGQRRRK